MKPRVDYDRLSRELVDADASIGATRFVLWVARFGATGAPPTTVDDLVPILRLSTKPICGGIREATDPDTGWVDVDRSTRPYRYALRPTLYKVQRESHNDVVQSTTSTSPGVGHPTTSGGSDTGEATTSRPGAPDAADVVQTTTSDRADVVLSTTLSDRVGQSTTSQIADVVQTTASDADSRAHAIVPVSSPKEQEEYLDQGVEEPPIPPAARAAHPIDAAKANGTKPHRTLAEIQRAAAERREREAREKAERRAAQAEAKRLKAEEAARLAAEPKRESEHRACWDALKAACKLATGAFDRARFGVTVRGLRGAGATPELIAEFGQEWWPRFVYFGIGDAAKGIPGRAPKFWEVLQCWGEFLDWIERGRPAPEVKRNGFEDRSERDERRLREHATEQRRRREARDAGDDTSEDGPCLLAPTADGTDARGAGFGVGRGGAGDPDEVSAALLRIGGGRA